ncbi:ABC-type transport system involved in cytochrome c biogenesis permease subunit [Bacillus mesophilus]|uniref:YisL family protein n=1 Tax=Bacillus mesophilus TaxID=1808955 RepID=A0A6M0Q3C4_9BACI|nr:YisL family protein [Bacillus mesophilus]MBM7659804.1 ABC-type transport system involved in cytochrome c biogenesis permease subunit [Bacillus mesophilus]NEY70663.1 YisL family protein [Bacillus mesophilus]
MIHVHVTTWFLTLVLFFVAVYLLRANKQKPLKIIQMVLRLLYLLVLGTGLHLLAAYYQFQGAANIKALVGLWVIFCMEFILTRGSKGKPTKIFWIQLVISLVLVFVYGYGILG